MTDAAPPTRADEDYIGALLGLARAAEDGKSEARAALARLRRTLGEESPDYAGLRDIGHFLPTHEYVDYYLETYLLVAALFASHPAQASKVSMGTALQRLRAAQNVGQESLDRRVATLLNSDREDLPYRLRQLVQMLKSKEVALNWYRLLDDLKRWNHASRTVQRQWARDYYTGSNHPAS